jgi:3-oxoacyl-[acyl-carrier protein] reductase
VNSENHERSRLRLTSGVRSLRGRTAIVTGAASGMGRATAHLLADEGVRIAIVDLDPIGVERVVEEIHAVHGRDSALGFPLDVIDDGDLRALIEGVEDDFGRLDILINNAGVSRSSSVDSSDDDFWTAWNRTLDVNVTAYIRLVRLALPLLRRSDAARIVNVASTESIVATPTLSAYSSSKAAVTGLTRSLAVELGREGITVNCVCPGPINTGMTAAIPDAAKEKYARRKVALRRYGEPEEVAHMTVSLCLPAMSFVTGASIVVDGGMTIRHT